MLLYIEACSDRIYTYTLLSLNIGYRKNIDDPRNEIFNVNSDKIWNIDKII